MSLEEVMTDRKQKRTKQAPRQSIEAQTDKPGAAGESRRTEYGRSKKKDRVAKITEYRMRADE
jgi:hypothetical protein